jgi:hypothetical protein
LPPETLNTQSFKRFPRAEPVEIPGSVTGITEMNLADVVVDAVDLMALSVEMFHGFRANQSPGTGNQNCGLLHLKALFLPIEIGRQSRLRVRFREFVSMVMRVPNR